MTKEAIKEWAVKMFDFACLCLYALAAIGGVAYLFFDHHGIFGVAALAVCGMALPYIIKKAKDLIS